MRRRCALSFIVLMLGLAGAAFAQQAQTPAAPQTPPDPDRPEYRARRLPTDVFQPSEQVEEDTPVAFPEDI
ncbi:MAG: hypothetical protein AB7I32_08040 [Gammaproteobacteria bacterium]